MITVLVWVLMTTTDSGHSGRAVQYSPPVATLADCERMSANVQRPATAPVCVQINMVVGAKNG